MVDQLNGTFFPDGPADWLHTPTLKALAERSARFANAYTASPLCAPGRASFMSGRLPSGTGSTTTPPNSPPTSRPSPTTCAARATRPACRARCISWAPTSSTGSRSADHRHLPRRFRLDPRLPQTRRADRLVVSQHGARHRRGRGRDHQPDGIRRRGRLHAGRSSTTSRGARTTAALVPDGQLHASARPLRGAARVLGSLRAIASTLQPELPATPLCRSRPPFAAYLRRQRLAVLRHHRG
jgi:hypothetical protein